MRGLLMALLLASVGEAQQIDTIFSAPGRRIVDMSGVTGSVEIKTWSRPEVRVQVRGAGVSRVKLDLTASMVVVNEMHFKPVPKGFVWLSTPTPGSTRIVKLDTLNRDSLDLPPTRQGVRGANFRSLIGGSVGSTPPRPPASVDYTITVPSHGGVVVRGSDVEIIVSGTIDTLSLSNVNGAIRASNVSGKLNLSSLNGRILVEGASGDLLARTLGGSIAVRGADATVEAHAGSGTIELVDVRGSMVSATTVDGGISLSGALPANGSVTLSTMRGPLGLPQTGPCSKVFPEGEKLEIRPSESRLYRLVLTTTAPGNSREAVNCALRRD
jgi:hypothetical protein